MEDSLLNDSVISILFFAFLFVCLSLFGAVVGGVNIFLDGEGGYPMETTVCTDIHCEKDVKCCCGCCCLFFFQENI